MKPSQAVLTAFMEEMHQWELRCAERERQCDAGVLEYDRAALIGTEEYLQVFRRYCSQMATPRDYYFTEPPDYDAVGEAIVSEREEIPGLVEINTQQNYSHRKKHVFRMALENGEWRIVDRRIVLDSNEFLDASL